MKLGGKHLLWSSCASHLGADYFFFSAHVGMCMHKVAAGWEVGPMEGWVVVGFGVLGEKFISTTSLLSPRLQRHSRLCPF